MHLFSSLTNRIFVASALLAVVSIGIGLYHVNVAITSEAERELRRGLDEARTLIEENRRIRVEHFTREARLIADLPRLKAAVELDHPPTVRPVVEEYQQQLAADLFMVTDRRGQVLALLPDASLTAITDGLSGVRDAAAGHESSSFVPHPGGILQLVSVPIWIDPATPDILGTLSIGFSLDRYAAARFGTLMNSEVAFGVGDRVQSSTLPTAAWRSLAPLLARDGLTDTVWLENTDYIAMTVALASGVAPSGIERASLPREMPAAKAIVLRSRTERLSFLRALHTSFLFTAIVVVLAATGLSYGIARTVTGPLGTITATMREMARDGDLTRRIPLPVSPRWQDEDARLLASTFNTMTESIERFQREAAQRERLSSLGRLSTVVAHEIRNPLMIIKAALRGLRQPKVGPSEVSRAVADIDEEIARLNRLVTEVLDFAKPIRFDLAPVDLAALATDAARASSTDPAAYAITLRLRHTPAIVTDAERLRLVLVNILANARQAVAARPDGVVPPEAIVLTVRPLGAERVLLELTDRGAGIAADDLPRLFDPYFTTRRTGTGLGLAISRNIVAGLNGTITADSQLGQGTTVRIELPVR